MFEFEQETNQSSWKTKFDTFEVITDWEKYVNKEKPNLKLNEYRLVKIDYKLYLEVKTQKEDITFLTDLKHFNLIQNHTWYSIKNKNIFYIETKIKKDNNDYTTTGFHRIIYSEYKIIDHINREGLDNREINLQDGSNGINNLNCKLRKNNTSGYNGISYENNKWRYRWYENQKRKAKYFKTKEEAIEFKLAHDLITGNRNGYSI
jgi:hypothetical protein